MELCTEGKSLAPLLMTSPCNRGEILPDVDSHDGDDFPFAFSQYPRPGPVPTAHPNSDKPRLRQIKIMVYSARTRRYRYTEWVWVNVSKKTGAVTPKWTELVAAELYDYTDDPDGVENRADDPTLSTWRRELSEILHTHFE